MRRTSFILFFGAVFLAGVFVWNGVSSGETDLVLSGLESLAGKADISFVGTKYNRRTGDTVYDVKILNTSSDGFIAPVYLVVDSISSTSVVVQNPDGVTSSGRPYFVVLQSGGIGSGESAIGSVTLRNTGRGRFSFTMSAYGSLAGTILEPFDDQDFEDRNGTNANWGTATAGYLEGGLVTPGTVTVAYSADGVTSRRALTVYPLLSPSWSANGCRVQASYSAADLGGSGEITEIAWSPDRQALFAASHANIQIRLGHTNGSSGVLGSATFDNNFKNGVPSPSYSGDYHIPQSASLQNGAPGYWPFPKLETPFDYNGTDGLLIDIQADAGTNYQALNVWFWAQYSGGPGVRQLQSNSKTASTAQYLQQLVYDLRIVKGRGSSFGRSLFYDTHLASPDYGAASVTRSGRVVQVEYQGADGKTDSSTGMTVPDESTLTLWSGTPGVADGKRFVRFRVVMAGDQSNLVPARVDKIQIAYTR